MRAVFFLFPGLALVAVAVPVLVLGALRAGGAVRSRRLVVAGLAGDGPGPGHTYRRVLSLISLIPGMPVLTGIGRQLLGRRIAARRAEAIRRSLSDVLDLLAISVEAGAGLEGAMARVADGVEGPLGEEYRRVLDEMQLGLSRREALLAMKERVDLPEVSSFVLAVVQADTRGMAMGRILRTQAQEMRARRRRRAREQAAKTPVKILFPLVFGIFPAMLVVILGPAAIRILEMLLAYG